MMYFYCIWLKITWFYTICEIYALSYATIYLHIDVHIRLHRERKEKKETMCVTKAKITSFSGLCNGNNRKIFFILRSEKTSFCY